MKAFNMKLTWSYQHLGIFPIEKIQEADHNAVITFTRINDDEQEITIDTKIEDFHNELEVAFGLGMLVNHSLNLKKN